MWKGGKGGGLGAWDCRKEGGGWRERGRRGAVVAGREDAVRVLVCFSFDCVFWVLLVGF